MILGLWCHGGFCHRSFSSISFWIVSSQFEGSGLLLVFVENCVMLLNTFGNIADWRGIVQEDIQSGFVGAGNWKKVAWVWILQFCSSLGELRMEACWPKCRKKECAHTRTREFAQSCPMRHMEKTPMGNNDADDAANCKSHQTHEVWSLPRIHMLSLIHF